MAIQTGSYDFKAAKAAHDEASQTASNYITEINNDGIMVHAEGDGPDDTQTPSGWHISDVLEYIRNGISRFWIGLKNSGDTTPTVRIGKDYVSGASDNESHMELDYRSLKLVDKNNNTYLYASDLRDASGVATIKEIYVPNGIYYYLTSNALDTDYVVKIDGVVAPATKSITGFTVDSSDIEGASEVSVEYTTADEKAKAYTLGVRINALGCFSVAEGYNVSAVGGYSHAEGEQTRATGRHTHSEGYYTEARGVYSHAEGKNSTAVGESSHAEGDYTYAGKWAHSEGRAAYARGIASHAQNYMTRAASNFQTALGKFNVEDADDVYAVIIGNGTSDSRSNAVAVAWNGNVGMGQVLGIHSQPDSSVAIDNSANNGAESSAVVFGRTQIVDKNGTWTSTFGSNTQTNGQTRSYIGCNNMKTDGTMATNYFNVGVNKDGSAYYAVTSPAAFRNAINALSRAPRSSAELPACTAMSNVFPLVLGNKFANDGEISYMSAVNFIKMLGASMNSFYQATGASGTTKATTANTITPMTLSVVQESNGSGFSFSGGGIKVANAGKYRVTGSMYATGTNATYKGVYIKKNNNSTGVTGELMGRMDVYNVAAIQCGPKIVSLAANDVLYLCARVGGVAGTIDCDNLQTYLLVERIV